MIKKQIKILSKEQLIKILLNFKDDILFKKEFEKEYQIAIKNEMIDITKKGNYKLLEKEFEILTLIDIAQKKDEKQIILDYQFFPSKDFDAYLDNMRIEYNFDENKNFEPITIFKW